MIKAIDKFHKLEQGILGIVRAADVYALHTMAKIRNEEPDMDAIKSIMSGRKISGLNIFGEQYKKNELELLERDGHFAEIGQQIIVTTHTALESYLALKFREYYKFLSSGCSELPVDETLKQFNFRGLEDFKKAYKKFFGIHIPSFDIDYHTSDGCSFQPKDSWEALELIHRARNDIVHKGTPLNYQVSTLMDSWYPFEFARDWVSLFDVNFDSFIYQKIETRLYCEHKKRANKTVDLHKGIS